MKNGIKTFFSNINHKIASLSKIAIMLIIVAYSTVLFALVYVTEPRPDYVPIPTYQHVYFDKTINPQISIIANRTFDEDGKMTLKYSISVNIHGRTSESSNSDPGYKIQNFKMSASLVDTLGSNVIDKMYYFTEQTRYTTPITHSYTIDNSSEAQHPVSFYTLVQYKRNTVTGISTFKEDLMLVASASDIASFNNYYENNTNKEASSYNIYNKNSEKVANIQFTVKQSTTKDNVYNCGVKIAMESLNYKSNHHIDMQTWIETTSGEFLPFIGCYGYSNQRSNYVQSGRELYKELKPKYICIKTVHYYGEEDYKVDYFKQDITKLSESFTSNPSAGDDIQTNVDNQPLLYVAIGCGVAIISTFVIVILVYFIEKKRNNKEEVEENNEKEQEN